MGSQKLKVLLIEAGGWGGICHYTYNLCQALEQANCRVLLASGAPYELAEFPLAFELKADMPPEWAYSEKIRNLYQNIKQFKPDLIHIQSTLSARKDWALMLLGRAWGYPLVYTAHNILPHDESERNAAGIRFGYGMIYRFANCTIVHGETPKSQLIDWFGTSQKKIAVIPHGDYAFINSGRTIDSESAKAWLGFSPNRRVILFFGAIREYKGVPDLIEAFAIVAQTRSDVDLAIVGKPVDVDPDTYTRQIQGLGLSDRVICRPIYAPIGDIDQYFAAADIAVFPYRSIYQSGALQLAYASAKPVVVTRVGALPETVQDGQNGLVVPPEDPGEMAKALNQLLSLPEDKLKAMGHISRQIADQDYGWDDIAMQTVNLYQKLIGKPVQANRDNG